jgi:hypothetical protein
MINSSTSHDEQVKRLSEAQEPTGRQDLISPPPTTEKSDSTPVDVQRGMRLWVGFAALGIIFFAVIIYVWATR